MSNNQPPALTEQKRQALIVTCKDILEERTYQEKWAVDLAEVALSSLQAEPKAWMRVVSGNAFQIMEQSQRPHDRSGNGAGPWFAVYSSPPTPALQPIELPSFDGYLPHIAEELQAAFTQAVVRAGYSVKRHNGVADGQ